MPSERWREIERLYHLALEQNAESRSAFLAEACRGDEALREEVESLLAADEGDDAFLQKPAVQIAAKARAQDAAQWDISGKTLSHYSVIRQIGAGGMGVVYLARDETLDRQVALKVLPPGSLAEASARKRLRKEAVALAKLSHPNIETIYEFDTQDGIDFLVTEYVPGTTLADRIANGPLPESELLDIAVQICRALDEAASHGLVHLDLKPRNIMLTPKGQVKLLDFGLARIVRPSEVDHTGSLTTMAAPAGTPPYMAPEQLLGGSLDVRTDIYAVGATLYELATGRTPFRGKTSPELIASILQTAAAAPSSTGAGVSPGLDKVILKCLEKDPGRRYQSVGELLADLASAGPRAETAILSPHRPRFLASAHVWLRPWRLAVLFLGLASSVGAFWLLRSSPVLSFAARDWVLVADFENQTNDPLFDQSLLTAFSVSLEQSRHVNIYPRSRIREVLARMKKDAATRIDDAVGREIAVREGIRAVILPSISGVGDDYRLAARIRDVTSGVDVQTTVVKARGQQRILDSLDQLAAKVRGNLGESQLATFRNSRPLPAVTTASLDALKQYSIATEKSIEGLNPEEPKLYFENALKIDPTFTAARSSLGILDFVHFNKEEGKRLLAEAVRSADNLTDREKYGLLAFHARAVEGNLEKAAGYDRILIGLYPDFATGHSNLGVVYEEMGRYPEAIVEFQECQRIDPRGRLAFIHLAETYISRMGDLDGGIAACQKEIAKNGKNYAAYCWMGYAYLTKGQLDEAVRDLEQSNQLNPRSPAFVCEYNLAVADLLSGRNQNAIRVLNGILAIDPKACGANYYLGLVYESMHGGPEARRQWIRSVDCREEALRSQANDASDYIEIAIARARLGEAAQAQAAEEKAHSIDPNLYFDTARLRAVQGKTEEALALLERAEKSAFHDFGWVKVNPDLRSLSAEPRFVALLHRNLKGL
jgi:serine/threonine protein kinase/tetratricopeptide (TPR) repeat protein